MSAGKNVAIGCSSVLLLLFLAGWLGVRWVYHNYGWTTKEQEIFTIAERILPIRIPANYQPSFAGYSRKGQQDPFAFFVRQEGRRQSSTLILYARDGVFTYEEMFADAKAKQPGLKISTGLEAVGKKEHFPAVFQQQQVDVWLEEGLDQDQAMQRSLVVVLPQGERTILMAFLGSPEWLPHDLIQKTLDSVGR